LAYFSITGIYVNLPNLLDLRCESCLMRYCRCIDFTLVSRHSSQPAAFRSTNTLSICNGLRVLRSIILGIFQNILVQNLESITLHCLDGCKLFHAKGCMFYNIQNGTNFISSFITSTVDNINMYQLHATK